jgi:hypothetical protein
MNHIQSPDRSDSAIEREIVAKGKTAPRITPADLQANIVSEHYYTAQQGVVGASIASGHACVDSMNNPLNLLTFCVLTLRNGFTVTGESACASPENFNEEIGRKIARQNAEAKVWPLMGYALKERMHQGLMGELFSTASALAGADVETIARACHEVNRAYCAALGDLSQPTWEDAPDWQKNSARAGVTMHLANPDAGPQASHESWMAQKQAEGWIFGAVKRPEAKEHPCMVPFDQLPPEQQAKDYIFRSVVHAMARAK